MVARNVRWCNNCQEQKGVNNAPPPRSFAPPVGLNGDTATRCPECGSENLAEWWPQNTEVWGYPQSLGVSALTEEESRNGHAPYVHEHKHEGYTYGVQITEPSPALTAAAPLAPGFVPPHATQNIAPSLIAPSFDPEIAAIQTVSSALRQIDDAARRRVMDYIRSRFG